MKSIMKMKITNLILAYLTISICMNTAFGMDQQNSMNTFAVLGAANNISPIRIEFNSNSSKHCAKSSPYTMHLHLYAKLV